MTTRDYIISTIKTHETEFSRLGIRKIGLFGSCSRNEESDKSDIDILLDFNPDKENFDNYMAVYDLIENLFQNRKIDIVTLNGLSPYIGPGILNDVLYV